MSHLLQVLLCPMQAAVRSHRTMKETKNPIFIQWRLCWHQRQKPQKNWSHPSVRQKRSNMQTGVGTEVVDDKNFVFFFWCVDCLLSKRWSGQKIFEIESPRLPPIKSSLEPNVFTTWHYEEFDSSLWPTPLMFTMSSGLPWTQQGKWTSTWLWSWVMSVQRCHWLPPGGLFIRPGQTADLGKYLTWASQQKAVCFRSYKVVYKPRRCWFTLKPQL